MAPNMCTILSKYDGKMSYKNSYKINKKNATKNVKKMFLCGIGVNRNHPKPNR